MENNGSWTSLLFKMDEIKRWKIAPAVEGMTNYRFNIWEGRGWWFIKIVKVCWTSSSCIILAAHNVHCTFCTVCTFCTFCKSFSNDAACAAAKQPRQLSTGAGFKLWDLQAPILVLQEIFDHNCWKIIQMQQKLCGAYPHFKTSLFRPESFLIFRSKICLGHWNHQFQD